ncbi:SH3 domain-binding protein 1 [Neosynchiropus ocellatus]
MLRQSLSLLKQLGTTAKSQDATELLHEDLVVVEQRVEPTKKAAQVLYKKLQACMQSQTGLDTEKRMKKLPLMLLSLSMAESLKDFDADSPIRRVLEMCCFMEKMLATMLAEFEIQLEKEVLEPLNKLSEEDLPEILKNKKQFAKLTMDWNNAKIKSQSSTGAQAKQDGLREEMEEAWRKLQSVRDQYSADLYLFATKEDDYSNYFIRLLELQAQYHKHSHEFLNKNISELKEDSNRKGPALTLYGQKVYGETLLSHLSQSKREIAAPIQECISMLLKTGMREEGLFRLAAAASVVKRLKSCLDQGTVDYSEFSMDPHAVAGALKCYLRELPEPLMTFELYSEWFKAAGEKDSTEKLQQFRVLLKKLPCENYNNLRYLVQFLSLLSEQQAVNKMSPSNIAIVLGPNLLWPQSEGEIAMFDMAAASSVQVVTVVEPLIQYSSDLFPEEASFEIPHLLRSGSQSSVLTPSEKKKVSRSASCAPSSLSSSSSNQLTLSKTNSFASQNSSLVQSKPAFLSQGGPTPPPRAIPTNINAHQPSPSANAPSNPVHTRSPPPENLSDQQPVNKFSPSAAPESVKMGLPPKPRRCLKDAVVPKFPKPKPPGPQRQPAPPSSSAATALMPQDQSNDPKKPPPKKPGLRSPNCPPPLPPPSQGKVVPSAAQ